jgi:hypothetical protein
MTTNSDRGSAKIYEFPARGRFAVRAARDEAPEAKLAPQVVNAVSSGWYHDAAIAEDRARKN